MKPFEGLRPARADDHAAWVVSSLREGIGVSAIVPAQFEACVRVRHRLPGGQIWGEVAPSLLGRDRGPIPPLPDALGPVIGDLPPEDVAVLWPLLADRVSTEECHFGIWYGWGEFHARSNSSVYFRASGPWLARFVSRWQARRARRAELRERRPEYEFLETCPEVEAWGGRGMRLFDGPIPAIETVGSTDPFTRELRRRSPQWWWPVGREWFVATEIDFPWSYVAGSRALIERVRQAPFTATTEVEFDDVW